MGRDHYEILGVETNATSEDIKRAYRRLAREHHPDANQGDAHAEERFKQVSLAYEVLSNPEARRNYDMFGDDGARMGGGSPFGGGGGIDDIFDAFFGGASPFGATSRRRTPAGEDLAVECRLDFVDAVFGTETDIEVRVKHGCGDCGGSGAAEGTHPDTCPECGGRGEVQQVRRTMLGQIVTAHPCANCQARGIVILHPCGECRGEGRVAQLQTLTVKVPGGVDDGAQLRLSGRGNVAPRGGPAGDLFVRMRVDAPPDGWSRDEADLHYALATPVTTAALGGRLAFTTLEGEDVQIEVKPGTQPHTSKRLRGKGGARLGRGGRGDLFVDLDVQVPKDLSDDQRELLTKLAELRGENIETTGVVGRIKQAFG